jgi:hypothetical protein
MVLTAAPRVSETMPPAVSDVAQGHNDAYLELFAQGPGRDWYVWGPRPARRTVVAGSHKVVCSRSYVAHGHG